MYKDKLIIIFLSIIFIILLLIYLIDKKINNNKELKTIRKKIEKLKEKSSITDNKLKEIPKYYINLERNKDRKSNFINDMDTYGLKNYHRISAIDGKKLNNKKKGNYNDLVYSNNFDNCSYSQLAITMSHIKAIKQAYDNNDKIAMITEDDTEFTLSPYWKKNMNEIIKDIPEDCDIFLLANRFHKNIEDFRIVKADITIFTGVCYLVTKKGMKNIIKNHYNDNTIIFNNLDTHNIIFDQGFLNLYNIYTYNQSLFLLDNFKFKSVHYFHIKLLLINYNICEQSKDLIDIYLNKIST